MRGKAGTIPRLPCARGTPVWSILPIRARAKWVFRIRERCGGRIITPPDDFERDGSFTGNRFARYMFRCMPMFAGSWPRSMGRIWFARTLRFRRTCWKHVGAGAIFIHCSWRWTQTRGRMWTRCAQGCGCAGNGSIRGGIFYFAGI